MFRRLSPLLALLCLLAALPVPGQEFESIAELEERWREFQEEIAVLPRAERVVRAKEFLQEVSWEQVDYYCGDYSADFGPDLSQFLGGFVDAMLRAKPADARRLARIIGDATMNPACHGPLVKFVGARQDSFRALPESDLLGEALFDLAESGLHPPHISGQLFVAAATLWAGEAVMRKMMDESRREDPLRANRGVSMLAVAKDAAATDSLRLLVAEYRSQGREGKPLGRALRGLASRSGAEEFPLFETIHAEAKTAGQSALKSEALKAMAFSQDSRFYAYLVEEYDDAATGIADSTFVHRETDRALHSHYWTLWQMTRLAEPGIIAVLESDSPAAPSAVEALDRASRFGLPAGREELLAPLEAWAQRRGGAWVDRISIIANRFRSYPDPRAQ